MYGIKWPDFFSFFFLVVGTHKKTNVFIRVFGMSVVTLGDTVVLGLTENKMSYIK